MPAEIGAEPDDLLAPIPPGRPSVVVPVAESTDRVLAGLRPDRLPRIRIGCAVLDQSLDDRKIEEFADRRVARRFEVFLETARRNAQLVASDEVRAAESCVDERLRHDPESRN